MPFDRANGSRTAQELLREAREARAEDIELADAMMRLVSNKDFRLYQDRVLQTRIDEFGGQLLTPAEGMDALVKMEFLKGAMFAFCLVRDLPSVIIAAIGEVQKPLEEQDDVSSDQWDRKAADFLRAP